MEEKREALRSKTVETLRNSLRDAPRTAKYDHISVCLPAFWSCACEERLNQEWESALESAKNLYLWMVVKG